MKVLVRIAVAGLVAAAASGCFLDEIDKSVNANKTKAAATAPGAPAATGAEPKQLAAAKQQPAAPSAPSWWETAKTLGSEESTSDIVGCRLGGRVEYMLRDDCLARGGEAP